MPKTTKKKQPKKGRKSSQIGKPRSKGKSSMTSLFTRGVCSITNPFCAEAIGSRWPDNSMTKSVGWSVTGFPLDIYSNAAGCAGSLFLGEIYQNVPSTAITWPSITYNVASVVAAPLPSGVARYRITSWGLKVSAPFQSPMTATGILQIRTFSPLGGSSLGTVSGNTTLADSALDVPVARLINRDVHIIPMPLGENARLFRDATTVTSTLASWVNPGWQVVQLAVVGAPASAAVLHVELFYNYELVFADGDASNAFAAPPPQNSPSLQNANASVLGQIGNFIEGGLERVDSLFQSRAFKYISSAAAAVFGGPEAGVGAYQMIGTGQRMRAIRDVD